MSLSPPSFSRSPPQPSPCQPSCCHEQEFTVLGLPARPTPRLPLSCPHLLLPVFAHLALLTWFFVHLYCPFVSVLGIPCPPFLSNHALLYSAPTCLNPHSVLKTLKQNVLDSWFASSMQPSASCLIRDSPFTCPPTIIQPPNTSSVLVTGELAPQCGRQRTVTEQPQPQEANLFLRQREVTEGF